MELAVTTEVGDRSARSRRIDALRHVARHIPRPLAALLGAVLLIGLAWALIVPPWQAPDETVHFAYAQSLAERFALPGDRHRRAFSTDQRLADDASLATYGAFDPVDIKPGAGWDAERWTAYLTAARHDPPRDNGGGNNSASSNPPLYYLFADIAYWVDYGGNAVDRLYAMQIWGVVLLMATVLGAWLLAGEVLGRRRLGQLACAAIAGLVPMETEIATSVTPDALLVALWTFALWLGARVIVRAAPRRDAIALCAVTAAAILTKATSYALVPPVLLALWLGWRRQPPDARAVSRRLMLRVLLVLAVPVLAWLGLARALSRAAVNGVPGGGHGFNLRQFISYLWQFYLPRLPFLTHFRVTGGLPVYDIWIREGWGVFGWLDVPMANWVYGVLGAISAAILIPAAALVAHFRDRLRLQLFGFLALALVSLLALLHVTDYLQIISIRTPLLQGRYLLPVVALFGLAAGLVITRLPRRWRAPACGALIAGLLVLQVLALGTVARMYYT